MKRIKIKIRTVSIALVLVISYLMVYHTVENLDVYIPTSGTINQDYTIVLDAGHGGYVLTQIN